MLKKSFEKKIFNITYLVNFILEFVKKSNRFNFYDSFFRS